MAVRVSDRSTQRESRTTSDVQKSPVDAVRRQLRWRRISCGAQARHGSAGRDEIERATAASPRSLLASQYGGVVCASNSGAVSLTGSRRDGLRRVELATLQRRTAAGRVRDKGPGCLTRHPALSSQPLYGAGVVHVDSSGAVSMVGSTVRYSAGSVRRVELATPRI